MLISVLGALSITYFFPKPSEAPIEQVAVVQVNKTPQQIVIDVATEYKVSAKLITELINLENRDWDPKRQSGIKYKYSDPKRGIVAGEFEKSFGLAQIHLPDHPSITYEQATNAEFAIRFIASEISQGRGWQWSCYRTAKSNVAQGKSGGQCTQQEEPKTDSVEQETK